jgi:4-amino-4-deoxy-L-arabinose transferase-like glycosyltransferase
VWIVSGAILAILLVVMIVALLKPREDLLGSNSIGPRDATAILPANQPLCMPHLRVPAGTGQVQYMLDTRAEPRPALAVAIHEYSGATIRGSSPPSPQGGHHFYSVPIPTLPARPEFVSAEVCLTAKAQMFGWGEAAPQGNVPLPTVGGARINAHVGIWFLGPAGAHRSIASQVGEMFRRAALFGAGFVGEWTYWLLLFLVMPALAYAALRVLATADADRSRRIPLALAVGLIAFGVAGSWALITPAFQAPDESEHLAYGQYFAETGKAVDSAPSTRPPYASSEVLALEAVDHTSVIELPDARPPWLAADRQEYKEDPKHLLPRDNGGGFHPATSTHTPAYYSLLAPGYLLTRGDSAFSQLFAMRLTSALLGALTAILAMLIVGELLPGRRGLAAAAGLLVAFEPVFALTSGSVNNDNGVNTAAALLIYLIVRALRRGMSPLLAAAIGATLVAAPLLKATGYELYLPATLALALMLVRRHGRRDLLSFGVLLATFAILQLGWSEVSSTLHRSVFSTPGGGAPGVGFEAFHNPKRYLSWLIRVLLPFKPPFIHHNWTIIHWPFFNIYIERGFASFGWYAIFFAKWVYLVIVAALAGLIVLGLSFLWRRRGVVVRYLPELAFLVLVPVAVICAVEAAFQPSLSILPIQGTPEEGRYAFPAITAVATLAIGACLGLGRERALPLAAGLVACLVGLTMASQWLTLSAFYT